MDWEIFKRKATRRFVQLGMIEVIGTDEEIFNRIAKGGRGKLRYTISLHHSGHPWRIIAIQGHTARNAGREGIDVNIPVTSSNAEELWHCTTEGAYRSILKYGLLPGGLSHERDHVYFSILELEEVLPVGHRHKLETPQVGVRKREPDIDNIKNLLSHNLDNTVSYVEYPYEGDLVVMIDVRMAERAGCLFYQTKSGAVLCQQPVPPSCIIRIYNPHMNDTPLYDIRTGHQPQPTSSRWFADRGYTPRTSSRARSASHESAQSDGNRRRPRSPVRAKRPLPRRSTNKQVPSYTPEPPPRTNRPKSPPVPPRSSRRGEPPAPPDSPWAPQEEASSAPPTYNPWANWDDTPLAPPPGQPQRPSQSPPPPPRMKPPPAGAHPQQGYTPPCIKVSHHQRHLQRVCHLPKQITRVQQRPITCHHQTPKYKLSPSKSI